MDVTIENFSTILPQFKNCIEKCSFISFDAEFSGLYTRPATRQQFLDTHQQYYDKTRENATNFLILQVGICTFTWDEANLRFF